MRQGLQRFEQHPRAVSAASGRPVGYSPVGAGYVAPHEVAAQSRALARPVSQAPSPQYFHAPSVPRPMSVGAMFVELRRALQLSLADVASLLGTRIDVIAALEAGDVERLPPWPETARIVSGFTGLAGIDPRPVLGVLRAEIEHAFALQDEQDQAEARQGGVMSDAKAQASAAIGRARGALASTPLASLALKARALTARVPSAGRRAAITVVVLFLVATFFAKGSALQASLATLQPPIERLMKGAQDYLLWRAAPVREGLRWIEVDDPRTRKADRLALPRSRDVR